MDTALPAVAEVPIRVEMNGACLGTWTCTPERIEALAAGWLQAGGYIECAADLVSVQPVAGVDGWIRVAVVCDDGCARAALELKRHRRERGCGPLHFLQCEPQRLDGRARSLPLPAPPAYAELFRALFGAADRFRETGGIHSAALTDGASLLFYASDVGRHNAVDKVLGGAQLADHDVARTGLILTARISGEIAVKGARAGVAWIASRSIPTTLAVQVATAARLPLVARAAGRDPRVFLPGADAARAAP